MRLSVLGLFLLVFAAPSFAQDNTYIKKPALGLNFFFNDFGSAAAIRANPLGSAIRDKKLGKIEDMAPGLAISYVKGITSHLDLAATIGGAFQDYPAQGGGNLGTDGLLVEADASVRAKMLSDKYFFVPYLTAGVGLSTYKGYYGATIPVGAGIQMNLFNNAFLIISSQYRVKVTDNTNYHFVHSIGFIGSLAKSKD